MDYGRFKEAADAIEIPSAVKNRIKANCVKQDKSSGGVTLRKMAAVICTLALILFFAIGFPYLSEDGKVKTASFAITAYAKGEYTVLAEEEAAFEASINDRYGLIGTGVGGLNYIFANIGFSCAGDNIKSVVYTMSEGFFFRDVTLTDEEANQTYMAANNIVCAVKDPNLDYWEAVQKIGASYTVAGGKEFAYSLAFPCDGNFVMDDITIEITVTYADGSTESQSVLAAQEIGETDGRRTCEILLSLE